jgi:hypothetical protein
MVTAIDCQRLCEIDREQARLVYRLVELKREESEILSRYKPLPVPQILADRRRETKAERVDLEPLTPQEQQIRKKARETARAAYFQRDRA